VLGPALGIVALVMAAAACGVPTGEDSFTRLGSGEVPFRLAEPSTTTTTTTTTTVPTTTIAETPSTVEQETTTTLALETVDFYFVSRGELQAVPRDLPMGFGINQLASGLEAGPPEGTAGIGLETLVEEGLIIGSAEDRGVVTVDLAAAQFDEIATSDQRRAIGQIVLTYTGNLRGVGQVAFTLDGEQIRVPRGDGLLSEPGEALAFDDYAVLLAGRGEATSPGDEDVADSTTTTTTTTTSDPPPGADGTSSRTTTTAP
jgi:hypothetical protein